MIWSVAAKIATRLTPLALGLIAAACADDDEKPAPKPFTEENPDPTVCIVPRNCRYTAQLKINGLYYSEPFTPSRRTPAEPVNAGLVLNIDRLQLPYQWDEAETVAQIAAVTEYASFSPFESSDSYDEVCTQPAYFADCGRSRAFADARRFGRDLTQQCFWEPAQNTEDDDPKNNIPEVVGCVDQLFEGAELLKTGEKQQMGPVWFTQGGMEFAEGCHSAADITLNFRTTVEDLGNYEQSVDRGYFPVYDAANNYRQAEGIELTLDGKAVQDDDGNRLSLPTFQDEYPVLLTSGLTCLVPAVTGSGSFEGTCCVGEDCHPAEGIGLDDISLELDLICDGEDASPQE